MKKSELQEIIREEISKVLNETIEIVSFTDNGISNTNKSKYNKKHSDIEKILKDSSEWTDDIMFKDVHGNGYFVDDLIGKSVKIGNHIFKVQD